MCVWVMCLFGETPTRTASALDDYCCARRKGVEGHGGGDGGGEESSLQSLSIEDILPESSDLHFYEKPIAELTVREFRDTLEAVQLHMKNVVKVHDAEHVQLALLRLFIRFGVLAGHAAVETVMDDPAYVTRIPNPDGSGGVDDGEENNLFILTCKGMRTFVDIFYVLFRCMVIVNSAESIQVCEDLGVQEQSIEALSDMKMVPRTYVTSTGNMIKSFHIEASMDIFNRMQQIFFLAPAQRLVYKHNFSGMYNDISQVTYFHYPDYVRCAQCEPEEMLKNVMNSLPCFNNLIPDVAVYYDDEAGTVCFLSFCFVLMHMTT